VEDFRWSDLIEINAALTEMDHCLAPAMDASSSSRKGMLSLPNRNEKRSPQFYRDLADDARLLSAALKDRASRSVVAEVAAAFDAAADAFDEEGEI
jgi:hypothetical protein